MMFTNECNQIFTNREQSDWTEDSDCCSLEEPMAMIVFRTVIHSNGAIAVIHRHKNGDDELVKCVNGVHQKTYTKKMRCIQQRVLSTNLLISPYAVQPLLDNVPEH